MKKLSRVILAFAIAGGLLAVTSMARADEWNDHEQHARDWHDKHMHHHDHDRDHDRPVIVEEPNVVYAPPVIVEPPAPEDDSSSGLNIVIPINIR